MADKFIRLGFEKVFNIEKLITLFYMEFSKDFAYDGEEHDFWEMVYIDRGEVICTAGKRRFALKSGELTFHRPGEFHAIRAAKGSAPNVSIVTFECRSRAMQYFRGKIFPLSQEEKALVSMLFREGISAYSLVDRRNPLLQEMTRVENAPFGSSQMTKNLLEIFLIRLHRHESALPKRSRYHYKVDGVDIPYPVKEILDLLEANVYGRLTVDDVDTILAKYAD